jgi:hypothetical protein
MMAAGTFPKHTVSERFMKPTWTPRQLLAILRGLAIMVGLFWALILLHLGPAFLRGGVAGVRESIARVAIAGVPSEHWDMAISRMHAALALIFCLGAVLFLAQRYLGRRLAAPGSSGRD